MIHFWIVVVCWTMSQATLASSSALERKSVRPPLVEEMGKRNLQRQTHCQFGNNSYELEERWRPDLGPPFGMLYCMRCECIPVQRKRRIMSRVRCKNIKNDCPKPTCEDPVLLPQRCCKSCPGEDYADLEEDIAARKLDSEEEDKLLKEFTVLLTGRILVPPVLVTGAARGHLVYTKRDLHYTIHYRGMRRPTLVRFTNEEGNILVELDVPNASHHVQDSKVCGVWRKVPKVYRRLLQKDKLLLVLVTDERPDGVVGGRIMKHSLINTEVFGALLLPDSKSSDETLGSGGMAAIFPLADSIHVTLGFNGIFTAKDARDVPLYVSLSYEDHERRKQLVSETTATLAKAHPDYNSVTVKLDLAPHLQERLSSAKFELKIASKDGARYQTGRIAPKVTCNVFQAVMVSTEIESSRDPITGFVLLDIGPEGFVNYKLRVSDPHLGPVNIHLETDVETPTGTAIRLLQEVDQSLVESWGNGSFNRRSSQEVEMLLTDDLMMTVTSEKSLYLSSASPTSYMHRASSSDVHSLEFRPNAREKYRVQLRGQVRQRLYTEALLNEVPLLLSGGNTTAGGVAWLSIDKDCVLHYQVYVSGLEPKERHLLELLQIRPGKYTNNPQKVLKRFAGDQVEDLADDLDGRSLAFLQAGYTQLIVTSKLAGKSKTVQLRANIPEMTMPVGCIPRYDASDMQRNVHTYQDGYNDVYGTDSVHTCIYEDTLYEDGAWWKAKHEDCTMCSCRRSRVECERMICPDPLCDNPERIPGECCPVCSGNLSGSGEAGPLRAHRHCFFDGNKHAAGSRWYPYVPPFGYSKCSVCTCEPKTLTVRCERMSCPTLTCPEKESFREHPKSCCKKCPSSKSVKSHVLVPASSGQLGDQEGEKMSAKEILAAGGCKHRGQVYPNGEEWHPTIEPYGAEKCIKCHCKDGHAKCKRKKCPKESCPLKVSSNDGCCDKCLDTIGASRDGDISSKSKKRRKDRERRHRRVRQSKELQSGHF